MNPVRISFLLGVFIFSCSGNHSATTKDQEKMSNQWLTFEGQPNAPKIVLISGDEEYRSEDALPQMAKILSSSHGFNCTVLFAQDPEKPGIINPNYLRNIPGLEHLETADLMIIFTRFRALPDDQMRHIDKYLISGKPVIGMRTATHAFNFKQDGESSYKYYSYNFEGSDAWRGGFGRLVLGEKWVSHHGHHKHQSTRGIPAENARDHVIMNGIEPGSIWGPTDVYEVRLPLPGDSKPIVMGQVTNRAGVYDEDDLFYGMKPTDNEVAGVQKKKNKDGKEVDFNPNDPMMPIAWTKSYELPNGKKGKSFTTTMGAATDLLSESVRRMLVNAVFWSLDMTVPEKANVNIVGTYQPRSYASLETQYWLDSNDSIPKKK